MSDLPSELRTLVTRYGTSVLDDPDGLRATLDDFLDEGSSRGDVNLLVDAVRFGSLDRLKALLDEQAEPYAATADVAQALAERRGGDAESAYWAAAVLGYAAGLLPGDLIPGWVQPGSQLRPPETAGSSSLLSSTLDRGGAVTHKRYESRGTPAEGDHPTQRPGPAPVDQAPAGQDPPQRPGRTQAVAGLVAALAVVGAVLIYVFVTRSTSDDTQEARSNEVPVAQINPAFDHFGPGGLSKALKVCGNAAIPGGEYQEYNCAFTDEHGPFDLKLTEKDPMILNRDGQLPGIVEEPPANTIVTTQPGQNNYHAYYLQWAGDGKDDRKNSGDDEVLLTLYDVDPTHPGAAVFTARDSESEPLTRDKANSLLTAIGAKAEVFPLPVAFQSSILSAFAQPFLDNRNLSANDCVRAFTVFNGEYEHVTCTDGPVTASFGRVDGDGLGRTRYRYHGTDYAWSGQGGSGRLIVSPYGASTRLYWDDERTQSWGILVARTRDLDDRQLRAYFEGFHNGSQVVPMSSPSS